MFLQINPQIIHRSTKTLRWSEEHWLPRGGKPSGIRVDAARHHRLWDVLGSAAVFQTSPEGPKEDDAEFKAPTCLQIPQILIWLSCAGKKSDQWRPHHGSGSALTCRGSSCSVWHRDTGSGSVESCRSCGRASMDLTCSGTSHECTMGKKMIWEIWRAGRHRELFVTITAVSLGTEGCALYF